MKELQLREAKTTLSAVVEAAENGEPTTITKHGRPAAVVISHAEWTKLKTRVPSFADLLLAVPPQAGRGEGYPTRSSLARNIPPDGAPGGCGRNLAGGTVRNRAVTRHGR